MGFDISNLGTYVSNNSAAYATKAVADAPTIKALMGSKNVQFGVKGTAAILKLNSTVTLVDGSTCSRTGGSSIALSNKNIVVKPIKDEANLCSASLWNTFYADSIGKGQVPSEDLLPAFADAIMNDRAGKIAETNEQLVWQGNTSLTGSTNLKRIDGILVQATSATTVSATGSTTVEKLQHVYKTADSTVRNSSDFRMFVGQDVYDNYLIDLAGKNIYKPTEDFKLFGTSATLFPTVGLNGTGKVFGTRLSNLHVGMDGEGDADKATMKYSVETENWYQDFKYSLGVAVVFNDSKEVTIGSGF